MTSVIGDTPTRAAPPAPAPEALPPQLPQPAPAAAPTPVAVARRRKRLWTRSLLAGGALLLLAILIRIWLPEPVPVEVGRAVRGPLRVTVAEDGRTRVKDRFVVSAPASGTLLRVSLKPGDSVVPGQVLARIVPLAAPLLDARTRAEAEARIAAADAAVRQARTEAARADAALDFANRDAERSRALYRDGAGSAQSWEQADLAARTRAEEAASARFGVQVAEHEAQLYRAALDRLTSGGSGRIELRSPVRGVVLGVQRESEGPVQAGQPVLEVGDPAALEVEIDLLTADAARVRPGAAAIVERWGGEGTLRAHVRRVEPSAFTKISALGVEEQRVNVLLDLDEPASRRAALGDGFRVEAEIVVWESGDALSVPVSALFRHAGAWAVFRVENGRARLRPVSVGQRTDQEAEILEGLDPGDVVVVYPGEKVKDRVRVEPAGS